MQPLEIFLNFEYRNILGMLEQSIQNTTKDNATDYDFLNDVRKYQEPEEEESENEKLGSSFLNFNARHNSENEESRESQAFSATKSARREKRNHTIPSSESKYNRSSSVGSPSLEARLSTKIR